MKGMVCLAAAKLGCDPDTIHNRAKTSRAVAQSLREERGRVVDLAELKLFKAIENGERWAVQLCLKTLGRDRGYVERQEVDAALDASANVNVHTELDHLG